MSPFSFCFVAVAKEQLKEDRFRFQSIVAGESQPQELEVTGHVIPGAVRREQ